MAVLTVVILTRQPIRTIPLIPLTPTRLSLLFGALALGTVARLIFIYHHPFSYDESAYLYDAQTLLAGRLPAGDSLTKAPVVMLSFMGSVWITSSSLFAARGVSLLFSLLTTVPLAWLGYQWQRKPGAISVALLWLLSAGPIMLTSFGHTHAVALFFVSVAVAVWVMARTYPAAALTGFLLAVAIASRKTAVFVLVPLLLWWWQFRLWRRLGWFFLGLLGGLTIWAAIVFYIYGGVAVGELLGLGYLTTIFSTVYQPGTSLGWGGSSSVILQALLRVMISPVCTALVGLAGGIWLLSNKPRQSTTLVLTTLVWLGMLLGSYILWPTFLLDYIADFLPAITLLTGFTIATLYSDKQFTVLTILILFLLLVTVLNLYAVSLGSWTGSFSRQALAETTRLVQATIPPGEPVFTAAVIIPYLTGHQAFLDLSHPTWYRYPFIPADRKHTFLPPLQEIHTALQTGQVRWALLDQTTRYMYEPLQPFFAAPWHHVETIQNYALGRSNTIQLWHYGE